MRYLVYVSDANGRRNWFDDGRMVKSADVAMVVAFIQAHFPQYIVETQGVAASGNARY